MDDDPRFLFQHLDLAVVKEIVTRGHYKKDGVEYDRLSLTLVRGDQLQSSSKHWVVQRAPDAGGASGRISPTTRRTRGPLLLALIVVAAVVGA